MDPALVLYGLCGLVGLAIAIFVVGSLVSVLRRPQLPDLASLELGQAALTIAPISPFTSLPIARSDNSTFEVQATTPFQRAVRALTPVPWLPKLPPAPISRLEPAKPRIDIPDLPRLSPTPGRGTRTVERDVSVVAVPSLTPKPELVAGAAAKPAVTKTAAAKTAAAKPAVAKPRTPRAPLPAPAARFASWEARYPRKRRRGRIALAVFALLVASSGVLVAAPHLIDPLCDDYEWFGDGAASSVRELAVDAHDTIASWV